MITYTNSAYMEVTFRNGVIQGMARRFDKNNVFEMIGNYHNGLPHGPFWIGNYFHQKFILVHLHKGQIVSENVVQFDVVTLTAIQGNLVNGSLLDVPQQFQINKFGEYKSIKIIPTIPYNSSNVGNSAIILDSYIEYVPFEQRILVRPSNFLFFNRIPKTGSSTLKHLISKLMHGLQYRLDSSQVKIVNVLILVLEFSK